MPEPAMVMESLRRRLGEKVSTNPSILELHGRDEGYSEVRAPIGVVFAESTDDVREVLAWANEHGVPVIPFGAGTSLEGQLIPQGPAVSIDLTRMNRIIAIRPEDYFAVVEPGLTYPALNKALRRHGLFFPVDPGAEASLGGMAATNASGTMTVRYGSMRQNVLALQVALANGEVLELGRPVRKTSSGYALKDLIIGSEGTLGVITRLTVRLHAVPSHIHALRVFFPTVETAAQAAYTIMATALPVARLELLDEMAVRAVNQYLDHPYPENPALFLEFHTSSREAMEGELAEARRIVGEAGGGHVEAARGEAERSNLWEARHKAYWAFLRLHPGRKYLITDATVPLSRMPQLVVFSQQLLRDRQLDGSVIGHVGDGNFHVIVAAAPGDYARAEEFAARVVEAALEMGGTATGEHGIGLRKKQFLFREHASSAEWMRRLKSLFDPKGLLNPGKIFDAPTTPGSTEGIR